ncbi:MAG: hypothetical protein AB8B56_12915 [Crocinitomicaceae bacterium]
MFIALFLHAIFSHAQESNEQFISKTFKEINRTDQSNLRNHVVRDSLILINFELIQSLLKDSVNLNSEQSFSKRTTKRLHLGLAMTFIHIGQNHPDLILNDETSAFIAEQINQGRLNRKELKIALHAYMVDVENDRWSESNSDYYREKIAGVKTKWGIE